MRTPSFLPVFMLAILIGATTFAQDDDRKVRRWTDLQSGQSVRAFLAEVDNGIVTLQTRDGRTFEIDHNRLSNSDRRYIRNQLDDRELAAALQPETAAGDRVQFARPTGNSRDNSSEPGYKSIDWTPMEEALASSDNEDDKPVFWFRVLGDLDGFM